MQVVKIDRVVVARQMQHHAVCCRACLFVANIGPAGSQNWDRGLHQGPRAAGRDVVALLRTRCPVPRPMKSIAFGVLQRNEKSTGVWLIVAVVNTAPGIDENRPVGSHNELASVSDVVGKYRRAEARGQCDTASPTRARRRRFVRERLSKDPSLAKLSCNSKYSQAYGNSSMFLNCVS